MSNPAADAPTETADSIMAALQVQLADVDWALVRNRFPDPEALADRMVAAIPDAVVDWPIGPCYSTAALVRWTGKSRQAIARQRTSARILGFTFAGLILHPAVQFADRGTPLAIMRVLLTESPLVQPNVARVTEWLEGASRVYMATRIEVMDRTRKAERVRSRVVPRSSDLTLAVPAHANAPRHGDVDRAGASIDP
jgi:hypothetical protein